MKDRAKILGYVVAIILVVLLSIECLIQYKRTGEIDTNYIEEAIAVLEDVNESSTEIPGLSIEEEQELEVQEVESEAFELQGEIAYEGDAKTWNISTGNTPQLTYISQIDSRWKNHPYTSTGNSSQTIGSSGCGVASAAMIIDSIVGNVDVIELADTFVANGYRSVNNGTYWSAYRAVADQFNIGYTETSNLNAAIELLRSNHYIIASCGNGLFTTGGHYIVLYGLEGDTIKIYDPYLYNGKFETSTRRGKVTVSGNTVYCSIDNFRNYANYKQFFCYKYNVNNVVTINNTDNKVTTYGYTRYVNTNNLNLNVRSGPGTDNPVRAKLSKGTEVSVIETDGDWSRITKPTEGWVYSDYLSSANTPQVVQKVNSTVQKVNGYTTGNYKVRVNSILNVRSGAGTQYKAKTYKQLTTNARAQNKRLGNYYANGYKNGVVCTVIKVQGNWGLTASGWICLDYCRKI